jgi:hypothetical protein
VILPYQPQSTRTYSQPIRAARSVKYFIVAVFIVTLKSAPGAQSPLHQRSQADRPGLIQEVSSICSGVARLATRFDSTSRPGWSAIMSTRQGERWGVLASTATPGSSGRGDSVETSVLAAAPWPERYIPAQSRRSDSVMATNASRSTCTRRGSPMIEAGVIAPSVVRENSDSWCVVKLP